jgi:general secretion pathway protein I
VRLGRRDRGFTLLEVLVSLAILGSALVVLLRMSSTDIRAAHEAKLITIATGLARAKMYDIEEELRHNGFQDTAQNLNGNFADEGQPKFTWEALVEKVELPEAQALDAEKKAAGAAGAGTPPPAPTDTKNQQDLLGLAGGSTSGALGASMVQLYFPLIKPVLENAIRKVTLTVKWQVGSHDQSMKVICFFTDTKPIDQALGPAGSAAPPFGGSTPLPGTTGTPGTPSTSPPRSMP